MDRFVICWFQSVSETPSEFAVLIALAMSKPTATLLELAEFAHVGRRTTIRAIDRLESVGVLRVDRAKGEVNIYRFDSWSKVRCSDHSLPSMFVRQ